MADVSHELGTLRYVVDSPLSSKVAMFNNAATKHQESQHLNPFSQTGGLPRPTLNKGESGYGKPLAGSLTEMRGQKANIHVLKEMLELCQIIDSEGYEVKDEPGMRVIPFGELFNIYTYISDKVVGILLRARKHKLIEFEGECLFQRRDDNVPVFLLKPIKEIRQILEQKQDEIRRSVSPAPQATSIIVDHQKRCSSLSPTPFKTRASKSNESQKKVTKPENSKTEIVKPIAQKAGSADVKVDQTKPEVLEKAAAIPQVVIEPAAAAGEQTQKVATQGPTTAQKPATAQEPALQKSVTIQEPTPVQTPEAAAQAPETAAQAPEQVLETPVKSVETPAKIAAPVAAAAPTEQTQTPPNTTEVISPTQTQAPETLVTPPTPSAESSTTVEPILAVNESNAPTIAEEKTDINNNEEAPAIVATVEASSNTESEPPAEAAVMTVPNVA